MEAQSGYLYIPANKCTFGMREAGTYSGSRSMPKGDVWKQTWYLANVAVWNAYAILCVISWPDFIPNFSTPIIPLLFKPSSPNSQHPITSQYSFCLDNQREFTLLVTKNPNGLLSTLSLGCTHAASFHQTWLLSSSAIMYFFRISWNS